MKGTVLASAMVAAACVCSLPYAAQAFDDNSQGNGPFGRRLNDATIAARQNFFGAENVDPQTGQVMTYREIFSWITNAAYAA